jgi:hypothetical protein
MLGGVDAIAVDAETVDPAAVNVDKPASTRGFSVARSSSPEKSP